MSGAVSDVTLCTIGHSTRPAADFVALLRANGIRWLVDVRRYPGSRRHPQYNREPLAAALREAGIGYRHEPALGGRRAAPAPDSPNRGWRNASFRAYADHLGTPEAVAALHRLLEDAARGGVAVMCAEAVPWRCHRQLIADALVARGHRVRHIISGAAPAPHELNELARVDDRGHVTYPLPPPPQRELFSDDRETDAGG